MKDITVQQAPINAGAQKELAAVLYYVFCEIIKLFRMPMFSIPTLLFPTLFFAMFGMPYVGDSMQGINMGRFMMSSFGTYAIMSVAMSSFSAAIATERGTGWNRFLRTTPLNMVTYFIGKIAMALAFEVVTLALLLVFGRVVGGVQMPFALWCELTGVLFIGTLPFVALGFFLGYVSGPNSATIIANLIFFPMAFASGLFMPLQMLPKFVQQVAPYLPSYNIAQFGWTILGASGGRAIGVNLAWIGGYTVLFLLMAFLVYRRDQGHTYG